MRPIKPLDAMVTDPVLVSQFWSHVDQAGPVPVHAPELGSCWTWNGSRVIGGYGEVRRQVHHRCIRARAHRFAYELLVGPIGAFQLDHLCRNRRCANPAHLEPVTCLVNVARSAPATKRFCIAGHELTEANVYPLKRDGKRQCRPCKRERSRRYYAADPERARARTRRAHQRRAAAARATFGADWFRVAS